MAEVIDVLIVEDDPYDVELIGRELAADFPAVRVKWLGDGERALKFLLEGDQSEQLPRLVLLDLNLPKVDGLQVLQKLRADARTELLPIVVLSGGAPDGSRPRKVYELGANSYVSKPTSHDDYVKAVRTVVGYWLQQNVPASE